MKFRRCPRVYVTGGSDYWLRSYQMFKKGMLPNFGPWTYQTNKFIEIMTFIDGQILKFQKEMEPKSNGR
jgi:hypothetical protein